MFFLVYQCQRCQGEPEGFLVRRKDWTFMLEGRSPIEIIEVPNFVPKGQAHFVRDAIVARNSGKILAALFYLRTFIEQFARAKTGNQKRDPGDQVMDEYSATLPDKLRDQMPSLKEWYGKLSDAVHAARADADFFDEALPPILKHFEIRKVFEIS